MKELTKLILDDMKPALGVTEPGAIAYAAAKAKSYLEGEIEQVCVAMNSGMYKNAFTCGIPNSSEVGKNDERRSDRNDPRFSYKYCQDCSKWEDCAG